MACEPCWTEANRQTFGGRLGSVADAYLALIASNPIECPSVDLTDDDQ